MRKQQTQIARAAMERPRRGPRAARMGRDWLGVRAYAEQTGLGLRTVQRLVANEVIPSQKIGRNRLIPRSALPTVAA